MNLDLIARLEGSTQAREGTIPTSILITREALEKAQRIGELLDEKARTSYEWYMFPLAERDRGYIIRDILLPRKQTISHAHVSVSGTDVAQAAHDVEELNRQDAGKRYIIGWMHSHADFSTFHSSTDTTNIIDVLNSVSLNTETVAYRPLKVIESTPRLQYRDGKMIVGGQDSEDGRFEMRYDDARLAEFFRARGIALGSPEQAEILRLLREAVSPTEITVQEPIITGFCYSVVINNRRAAPDTLMAVMEEQLLTKHKSSRTVKLPLEIVDADDGVALPDDALRKLIDERIELPRRIFPSFGKGKRGGKGWKHIIGFTVPDLTEEMEETTEVWRPGSVSLPIHSSKAKASSYSLERLTSEFARLLFEDVYTVHGKNERNWDTFIQAALATEDLSEAAQVPQDNSYGSRFFPRIAHEPMGEFEQLILKYVQTPAGEDLRGLMVEYLDDSTQFSRQRLVERLPSLFEKEDIKELLSDAPADDAEPGGEA